MLKKQSLLIFLTILTLAGAGHAQTPIADLDHDAKIRADMVRFDPHYRELMTQRRKLLKPMAAEITAREAAGKKVECSHDIMIETRFLMGYTADFPAIDQHLESLKESLLHPELETHAEEESPQDGTWGGCFTIWWERLDASYDVLQMKKANGIQPKYRFSVLDRVNSPEKLKAYFDSITESDVAHTGIDKRKELNFAYVDLIRLIMADEPAGYLWAPGMKNTLLDLVLHKYRNQKTGWWGESYLHEGKREQADDLSVTFHIVQSLNNDVPMKRELATTLFAVKDVDYPVGWYEHGVQTNHNNMDVIVLMGASWSAMTPEQQKRTKTEIASMLHWCLTESLQPDGSFKGAGDADSIEEDEHFGANFLARIGYFNKTRRFWTDQDFPEAEANRKRIVGFIESHISTGAAGGAYYTSSLQEIAK
ncbi:hypothetical protein SAMN05421771_3582 [Granulicella pectinivorans]|jgi:hypothetical protein|uniref:Uncharacterized protein n=1 Tax=Granulicella pectinivorans TaxID=474950 RepID=A0A1I6MT78_9BACT|nr:hypothetical protein [Granulicella pectinivorans]SFS18854.1 hypothetical protein SAMN05421771_3582 [Granulicella pectinivorans]